MESKESNYGRFSNLNEVERLRYAIAQYKKYDARRKQAMSRLREQVQRQGERIAELEALARKRREETETLVAAYEGAKPQIANPGHRAYVFRLLENIGDLRARLNERESEKTRARKAADGVKEENAALKKRISALEKAFRALGGSPRHIL